MASQKLIDEVKKYTLKGRDVPSELAHKLILDIESKQKRVFQCN